MGVATTYNPGSMSRVTAIFLVVLAVLASPAFSADPPAGTTVASESIDPETGLARSTVVRPLLGAPPVPDARPIPRNAVAARPHIALILPTSSRSLGGLADAVRAGFMAAYEVDKRESPPVHVTAVDNEATSLIEGCRYAQSTGALLVVGGLTRDGAQALAASDCPRQPVLALNELQGEVPLGVFSVSLSIEQEARQAALLAVADGWRSAVVIASASPLSKRVSEAFEREWTRAAGEGRKILYSGKPEDAPLIRERIASIATADMVFMALDAQESRAVRPYVSGMLPIYATSLSVNPRADPIVNVDLQGVRYMEMPWFIQPDHPAVMAYPAPPGATSVEQERLYALGIDAFRIALQLVRRDFQKPLDGVTGRIALEGPHTFGRALAPAEVDGGRVIPLRSAP
jgi:uncharacterized protein